MTFSRQRASASAAAEFLSRFQGRAISYVWFSDHRIIYLELGNKLSAPSKSNHPEHEQHIFLGYDWIFRAPAGDILQRSDPESDKIAERLLVGKEIDRLEVSPSLELKVSLREGGVLESISETEGDPDWTLRDGPCDYLSVSGGAYELEVEEA